jgi:hypothetical protein
MVTGHFGLAAGVKARERFFTVEAALLLVGAFLYWRAASAAERSAAVTRGRRANLVTALIVFSGLVVLTLGVLTA